ncbi:hypothetical protein QUF64_10295 [Anaerolineales bacterium HSG6]|nr:hypothetical protein [Anaerolineales bacterium HSG6]MDM8532325.1 hypothetical protein [Anaerolineales bacterium HSG25]
MAITSIRPVCRSRDGLKIFLTMSDWPDDAPLPPDTTLWRFGDGPSRPYWHFFLRPEMTVDKIVGIFNMPLSAEDLVSWYQTEMTERGWQQNQDKCWFSYPVKAHLLYQHSTEELKLELNILGHVDPVRCFVVLTRVGFHPWACYDEASELEE